MKLLSLTKDKTFSEFKRDFYSRFPDLSVFDCQDFNLLKVVLDGLKVNYESRHKSGIFIDKPSFYVRFYFLIKKIRQSSHKLDELDKVLELHKESKILFKGVRVAAANGETVNYTYKSLTELLPEDHYSFVGFEEQKAAAGDLDITPYAADIFLCDLSGEDEKLLGALRENLKLLRKKFSLTDHDYNNIAFAYQKFFRDYKIWNYILKRLNAKHFIFRCHYHFEGMLLAVRRNSVKAIELQHGLIASEDIFYVMPKAVGPVADKALFADEIWTYGNKWKEILLEGYEYGKEKIKVLGYYAVSDGDEKGEQVHRILKSKADRKLILVATQTKLFREFIQYIEFLILDLKKRNAFAEYVLVIKPHPNEPAGRYHAFADNGNVFVFEEPVGTILGEISSLVSCYSTVIIEALRYNVACYSLYIERCKDYIDSFVKEGYSSVVLPDENIIDKMSPGNHRLGGDLFAEVDDVLVTNLISPPGQFPAALS